VSIKNKILDCTLRDGGYYTNWDFDNELVELYFSAMESLPVDYVEIGYRNLHQKDYFGEFYYSPEYILNKAQSMMPSCEIAIMLNAKDIDVDNIDSLLAPCIGKVSLVRLAVSPTQMNHAMKIARSIKKNYEFEIAYNIMYMSKWAEIEGIYEQLKEIDSLVDYVYMVDSYGSVTPAEVKNITLKTKESLAISKIGFHGHNNLELALINTITALDAGVHIVDSTITGMGRGAGNLKTELLFTYLAKKQHLEIPFLKLSEIVVAFEKLQSHFKWGTNLPYMVSGANSLPQKDVMDYLQVKFYSIDSIVRALDNKRQNKEDNAKYPLFNPVKSKEEKQALVIGGGVSAVKHSVAIHEFCKKHQTQLCIIHASTKNVAYYKDLNEESYYCLVGDEGKRFEKNAESFEDYKGTCILSPYPREMGTYVPESFLKRTYELKSISFSDSYKDTHFTVALQTALDLSCNKIFLVGFDGYTNISIGRKEKQLIHQNEYIIERIKENIDILSLTSSGYHNLQVDSLYSYI